jgi:hypothetical protein
MMKMIIGNTGYNKKPKAAALLIAPIRDGAHN